MLVGAGFLEVVPAFWWVLRASGVCRLPAGVVRGMPQQGGAGFIFHGGMVA